MHSRLLAVLGLLVVVACAEHSGALSASSWNGDEVTITHVADIGSPVSFGGPMLLVNSDSEDVVITEVTIDRLDDQLSFLGWTVRDVTSDETGNFIATGAGLPFPPIDAPVPGPSQMVRSSERRNADGGLVGDQEVVIGLTLTEPGQAAASGVRVAYRDVEGEHELVFPLTAVLCGPRPEFPDHCDLEPDGHA